MHALRIRFDSQRDFSTILRARIVEMLVLKGLNQKEVVDGGGCLSENAYKN